MSALIGCHVSMCAPHYLVGSLNEAISYGANVFMIYTGAPQNTVRIPIERLGVSEFKQALVAHGIKREHVFIHAPYIINLANLDQKKTKFTTSFLKQEINRSAQIGIKYVIVHPGSALNQPRSLAIKHVGDCLNRVLSQTTDVVICIETMAGKGSEVGINFDEIKFIIDQVNDHSRIGVCMDTCHLNDAGYFMNKFDELLNDFDNKIGFDFLKVIHLNDSKNVRLAHKDRHENIGYGTIGFEALSNICHHERLCQIPKILETPFYNEKPPYKEEIAMLRNRKFTDWRNA